MTPACDRDGIVLYHGDCLDVMDGLPSSSIDVVLTDPPFSSGTRKEGSKGVRRSMVRSMEDDEWYATDSLTTNGFAWLMRQCALRWRRLLKRGGHAFVFIDWRQYPNLSAAIESADLRHKGTLVWDKTYFGMGDCFRNQHEFILHFTLGMGRKPVRRDVGNVLSFPPVRDGDHPNEKPLPLLREILSAVVRPGDGVLDCFMGSGAVGVAAHRLGCRFLGIDSDPQFIEVARDRLERPPGCRHGQASLFTLAHPTSSPTTPPV
jgi:site-specific DNA-methyltransferase (adenine-specific)